MNLIDTYLALDPKLFDILKPIPYILGVVAGLGLIYLIYVHITLKMAKKRGRDPLGWILLSLFVSPLLTWIILLIVGDEKR